MADEAKTYSPQAMDLAPRHPNTPMDATDPTDSKDAMNSKDTRHHFTGGSRYVLDEELAKIVNISIALEMPLLLKGEPGTGKTCAFDRRSPGNAADRAERQVQHEAH